MKDVKSVDYYYRLFDTMINHEGREQVNADFKQYDDMYHFNWSLPNDFKDLEWIGEYVSPVAHDTVNVTVKTLGVNEPRVHYFPPYNNEKSRSSANEIEEILKWNLYLVRKRKRGNFIADIVRHSCMYGVVCMQVIDLDKQIKSAKASGRSTSGYEQMKKMSPFMVNLYHPSQVYWRSSGVMLERVLLAQVKTADEIYEEFGEAAAKLKEDAETADEQPLYNLYDYMDDTVRVVLATEESVATGGRSNEDVYVIIEPQEHNFKFIPWVISCGGSDSELDVRDRFHGILYPLLRGKLWEFLNRAESLIHSKTVAMAGEPSLLEEGPMPMNNRQTVIDRNDPTIVAQVTPNNTLRPNPGTSIAPAMQQEETRLRTDITATTGTQSLQLVGVPEGTAYATLTLLLQNSAGNVEIYKQIAEDGIEGLFRCMLMYSVYSDHPLTGFNKNWKDNSEYGAQYNLDPSFIDPDRIYMEVELTKNLPIDQLQRVNTATMAVQTLGLSAEDSLEMCGIDNPLLTMNKRRVELLKDAFLQDYIARMQMAREMEQQQAVEAMRQQALAGMQNAPGAGANVQGQGFDTSRQGTPPIMANPNSTREMNTQEPGMAGLA